MKKTGPRFYTATQHLNPGSLSRKSEVLSTALLQEHPDSLVDVFRDTDRRLHYSLANGSIALTLRCIDRHNFLLFLITL